MLYLIHYHTWFLESYDPFLPAPSEVTNEPLAVELNLGILVDKIIMKDLLLAIMIKIEEEMFFHFIYLYLSFQTGVK